MSLRPGISWSFVAATPVGAEMGVYRVGISQNELGGLAQWWTVEAPKAPSERRRREDRGACAEGGRCGRGCPPPASARGSGGAL